MPPIESQQDTRIRILLVIEAAAFAATFQVIDFFAIGRDFSLGTFVFQCLLMMFIFGSHYASLVFLLIGQMHTFEEQCAFVANRAVRHSAILSAVFGMFFWIFRAIF
jgi:thiamine transporter ThiT